MATRNTNTNGGYTKRANTQKQTQRVKSWKDITGEMTCFGNIFNGPKGEYMSYSSSVGSKDENGDYHNIYYNVRFAKDNHPGIEGAFTINIKNAFLTVTIGKNKVLYPTVIIMDYDLID